MTNKFNPWHHVSPGDKLPDIVNGIVEIPKGTRAKYELDKETTTAMLDPKKLPWKNYPRIIEGVAKFPTIMQSQYQPSKYATPSKPALHGAIIPCGNYSKKFRHPTIKEL